MIRAFGVVSLVLLAAAAAAGEPTPSPGRTIAVLPLQDRAGDVDAAFAVEQALGAGFGERADVVDPGRARRALRRLRIRAGDLVSSDLMQDLGRILGADLLVTATLHDAERRGVPRMTVSVRAYSGATGELLWTGFTGASGNDDRKVFGRGVIDRTEDLAAGVVRRILDDLPGAGLDAGRAHVEARLEFEEEPGAIAVVPLDSITAQRRTASAETVTEAVRTALHRTGFTTVSPGCVGEVIRRKQAGFWGGIGYETRLGLREECGAEYVVTGSVETYDVGGLLLEPEPLVAVALRVIDTLTGRIIWMDELEAGGWDHSGVFRLGRVYSRGALAARVTRKLARRIRAELFLEGRGR